MTHYGDAMPSPELLTQGDHDIGHTRCDQTRVVRLDLIVDRAGAGVAVEGGMAIGRNPHVSRAQASEQKAADAPDAIARVRTRDNRFTGIRGRKDDTGPTFEPAARYAYTADDVDDVTRLLTEGAGALGAPDLIATIPQLGYRLRPETATGG